MSAMTVVCEGCGLMYAAALYLNREYVRGAKTGRIWFTAEACPRCERVPLTPANRAAERRIHVEEEQKISNPAGGTYPVG